MSLDTLIQLKASGRLPNTSLAKLSGASITAKERAAIKDKTCLVPDLVDSEIAHADPDDVRNAFASLYDAALCDAIQTMHLRMEIASVGSGGWPEGNRCHPAIFTNGGYHGTTFWVDWPAFMRNRSLAQDVTDDEWQTVVVDAKVWPSLEKPVKDVAECKRTFVYTDTVQGRAWANAAGKKVGDTFNRLHMGFWLMLEATRRAGVLLIEKFDGENGQHNIHYKHIPIPGSVSGYAYFPDATCGDHVTNNTDSGLDYKLGRWAGLLTHETGHNLKLYHEFSEPQSSHRSIMSYAQDNSPFQGYRLKGGVYQYQEDRSWPELRSMYGGEGAALLEGWYPSLGGIVLPPNAPLVIPGELIGRVDQGVYIVDGKVTIPPGAEGKTFYARKLGTRIEGGQTVGVHQLVEDVRV